MRKHKQLLRLLLLLPPLAFALLYGGGYVSQFLRNYKRWQASGITGSAPEMPSFALGKCLAAALTFPDGLIGIGVCLGVLALLTIMVMRMGYSETGEYDKDQNFIYSRKGT